MISKNVSIVDLDPYTWRNLGEIMEIIYPKRNTIYILHDKGKLVSAVQSGKGLVNDVEFDFNDINASVGNLFETYTEVEEVNVFEQDSLIEYYCMTQTSSYNDMDTDEYISFTNRLLHNFRGINIYKRDGQHSDSLQKIREYMCKRLPEDCTVVLGIFNKGKLYFNVILGLKKHKIELITTFDHLKGDGFNKEVTIEDHSIIANAVEQKFGGAVEVFLIEKANFAAIVSECIYK